MSDKEKILIADDSAMNRAILMEMLGDGYELLEAENGRQAVAMKRRDSFPLASGESDSRHRLPLMK